MAGRVKSYNSPLREEQARQTGERILQAARRLFREGGYGATSLADIAREAGVAEPTVRAVFKTKPNLVEHLLRHAVRAGVEEVPLAQRDEFQAVLDAPDLETFLDRWTEVAESVLGRSWDVLEIARGAASSDPAISELYQQRHQARRANQQRFAIRLRELGVIPKGTTAAAVADAMWALTSHDNYRLLRIERQWTGAQYRAWLRQCLSAVLR